MLFAFMTAGILDRCQDESGIEKHGSHQKILEFTVISVYKEI